MVRVPVPVFAIPANTCAPAFTANEPLIVVFWGPPTDIGKSWLVSPMTVFGPMISTDPATVLALVIDGGPAGFGKPAGTSVNSKLPFATVARLIVATPVKPVTTIPSVLRVWPGLDVRM